MIVWIIIILNIIICLIVMIFFLWNIYAIKQGAPFVPSGNKRIELMRQLANFKDTDVFLDIGSGDGRVLRHVAKFVKEARGIEINPILVLLSIIINRIYRIDNINIIQKDFWNTDLSDVDVLFVYCIDSKMEKLEKKIKIEMRQGTRIVSNGFILPTINLAQEINKVSLYVL